VNNSHTGRQKRTISKQEDRKVQDEQNKLDHTHKMRYPGIVRTGRLLNQRPSSFRTQIWREGAVLPRCPTHSPGGMRWARTRSDSTVSELIDLCISFHVYLSSRCHTLRLVFDALLNSLPAKGPGFPQPFQRIEQSAKI
jgi:hypothetical protein